MHKTTQDNNFRVSALGELTFTPFWPVVHILAPAEDYLVSAVDIYWPADPASTATVAAAHLSEAEAEAVRLVCHDHRHRRQISDWRCRGIRQRKHHQERSGDNPGEGDGADYIRTEELI